MSTDSENFKNSIDKKSKKLAELGSIMTENMYKIQEKTIEKDVRKESKN